MVEILSHMPLATSNSSKMLGVKFGLSRKKYAIFLMKKIKGILQTIQFKWNAINTDPPANIRCVIKINCYCDQCSQIHL